MAKYKVKNTNLLHNGKFVAIGSIVELTDEDAKVLEDVITPVKEVKIVDPKATTNKTNKPATQNADGETGNNSPKDTPADNTQSDGGNK